MFFNHLFALLLVLREILNFMNLQTAMEIHFVIDWKQVAVACTFIAFSNLIS